MQNNQPIERYLALLIIVSTLIRAFVAATMELGNDEVYYRLYALFPDWSHFDHPLMIGAFIQLFSFNLSFDSELFIRMSSVVFGAVNTWLIYLIGKSLLNKITGFYAALLYTASLYAFVIMGIFILPDTPQGFFWLTSLLLMVKLSRLTPTSSGQIKLFILLGISLGLGMLSKYTTIFLWFGWAAYIVLYDRKWLKSAGLYYAIFLSLICVLPILVWNIQNDFISFSFHSNRVEVTSYAIRLDYFITELLGGLFYNNPVNYVIILLAAIAGFRGKLQIHKSSTYLLLWSALPLILLFLGFSLFRRTLPHWTAPAITGLIPMAAVYLYQIQKSINKRLIPKPLIASLSLLALVLVLGVAQVNHGLLYTDSSDNPTKLGADDPSLDMFGYGQIEEAFAAIVSRDKAVGDISDSAVLIGDNWFPLANLDYYCATPLHMKSYGLGRLDRIHKYAWINELQGGFTHGMDAYFITTSRDYTHPENHFKDYFETIEAADTIPINRGGKRVKNAFVFRLKNLVEIPDFRLEKN